MKKPDIYLPGCGSQYTKHVEIPLDAIASHVVARLVREAKAVLRRDSRFWEECDRLAFDIVRTFDKKGNDTSE
jgi:hypothetical protein